MTKSKTPSDRKSITATLDEISKCFDHLFEIGDMVREVLSGHIPLPATCTLTREVVINGEDYLDRNRRARSGAFDELVQLGEIQLTSLNNVEKKAAGSVPFNKQVNIVSAMRNDCERRQKEAIARAERKSFTLAQVHDFVSHMKLVVKMVKTSDPTLKNTYGVLHACSYEVAQLKMIEENLFSSGRVRSNVAAGLPALDRYEVKATDDFDSCNSSEYGEISYAELTMTKA